MSLPSCALKGNNATPRAGIWIAGADVDAENAAPPEATAMLGISERM